MFNRKGSGTTQFLVFFKGSDIGWILSIFSPKPAHCATYQRPTAFPSDKRNVIKYAYVVKSKRDNPARHTIINNPYSFIWAVSVTKNTPLTCHLSDMTGEKTLLCSELELSNRIHTRGEICGQKNDPRKLYVYGQAAADRWLNWRPAFGCVMQPFRFFFLGFLIWPKRHPDRRSYARVVLSSYEWLSLWTVSHPRHWRNRLLPNCIQFALAGGLRGQKALLPHGRRNSLDPGLEGGGGLGGSLRWLKIDFALDFHLR